MWEFLLTITYIVYLLIKMDNLQKSRVSNKDILKPTKWPFHSTWGTATVHIVAALAMLSHI